MSAWLSAMLWFRAERQHDEEVRRALLAAREAIAPLAPARIGHRHEEDRPYRTWMIDAGPVEADRFEGLVGRLRASLDTSGADKLAQGAWQLERFEWLDRCA
jgi:hypothetical protein